MASNQQQAPETGVRCVPASPAACAGQILALIRPGRDDGQEKLLVNAEWAREPGNGRGSQGTGKRRVGQTCPVRKMDNLAASCRPNPGCWVSKHKLRPTAPLCGGGGPVRQPSWVDAGWVASRARARPTDSGSGFLDLVRTWRTHEFRKLPEPGASGYFVGPAPGSPGSWEGGQQPSSHDWQAAKRWLSHTKLPGGIDGTSASGRGSRSVSAPAPCLFNGLKERTELRVPRHPDGIDPDLMEPKPGLQTRRVGIDTRSLGDGLGYIERFSMSWYLDDGLQPHHPPSSLTEAGDGAGTGRVSERGAGHDALEAGKFSAEPRSWVCSALLGSLGAGPPGVTYRSLRSTGR
ncbi:hypothetical protein GGTG_00498 [Gaeumannomyces tritici R3-111a-1]|uniref:Uncharacterized protein n=1 Tax=Gaeumannomyces tritici (strain R3-111a-1) TaxID=644352 RepID=J3NGW2_GAET3|nr:hypothetical protein GGTG_00498 [Gaeumannomyces tritici R3-111a-1]EJT80502.1 hypothetical protein GGTG_00498 [Gaeumannomyces tritici R3-111a-1]